METARGLKRLRAIANAGNQDLHLLIGALKAGMLRDLAAQRQAALADDDGDLILALADDDGDLILELPPCNDEQAWRDRFGSMWLYYWISFGCWLP